MLDNEVSRPLWGNFKRYPTMSEGSNKRQVKQALPAKPVAGEVFPYQYMYGLTDLLFPPPPPPPPLPLHPFNVEAVGGGGGPLHSMWRRKGSAPFNVGGGWGEESAPFNVGGGGGGGGGGVVN